MAASDSSPMPIKNKAFRCTFPLYDNTGSLMSGGSNTTVVSKDGGTFTTSVNSPTEIASSSGVWYLDLTATEMNADTVAIKITNSGSNARPMVLVFMPFEIKEPTGVPGFSNGASGIEEWIAWQGALARNKMTQTATTTTLRNDADNASIATAAISDVAGTFTRGEWA